MNKKNVLLLSGGGSSEHEESLVSVKYIRQCLESLPSVNLINIEIDTNGRWVDEKNKAYLLDAKKFLRSFEQDSAEGIKIDVVVPCIHGYPGETGDIQSYLEMIGLPYLGCNSETSKMCFNKITTKLWATALGVPNTPYIFLSSANPENLSLVKKFQAEHGDMIVKASNQGSSVGCFLVTSKDNSDEIVKEAFSYSPFVLVEKRMHPRELEISVYEFDGKLQISYPGEIICPSKFYSYQEKYSQSSHTTTLTKAPDVDAKIVEMMTDYSAKLYHGLKLRHLSRIDYFLEDGKVYLNEINTFPGLTPISMFPKMMEANGHSFKDFLQQHISHL